MDSMALDVTVVEGRPSNSTTFIGTACPHFSWKLPAGTQRSWHIQAASTMEALATSPDLWDSGVVKESFSLQRPWGGVPLVSRQEVWWKVTLELEDGSQLVSEPASFRVALLDNSDWTAEWIHADAVKRFSALPCPYLRCKFNVRKELRHATLYGTARGLFELSLDGKRAHEEHFLPGWSDYRKQQPYVAMDLTEQLEIPGEHVLGAILGEGWYCGKLPASRYALYGPWPELRLQLELEYYNGTHETIATDDKWCFSLGPIAYSDFYDGEKYDSRRELSGWNCADFDDSGWQKVMTGTAFDGPEPPMVLKEIPGVKMTGRFAPVDVTKSPNDTWIWDFGQIITGRVRLHLHEYIAFDSWEFRLRFAEMLTPNGNIYTRNYRSALCTDIFISNGRDCVWEPTFTARGFRYVEIDAPIISEKTLPLIEVEAVALNTPMDFKGDFYCENKLVNQLVKNIRSSMCGNFFEVPMDCMQRDERLGWTGDALCFANAAVALADCDAFFRKYLHDLRDAQREDGAISSVAPVVPGFQCGIPAYADALPIIAWLLYERYGDRAAIEENYSAVRRWLTYEEAQSKKYIIEGHLDHLALSAIKTPTTLIGTLFFLNTARIAAKMAHLLHLDDDEAAHNALAAKILSAFRENFLDKSGVLNVHTQAAFALLFNFDVLDNPSERKANAEMFKRLVEENGNRLTTGFIGTSCLCQSLVKAGLSKTACDLLLQEEYPSWLYEVKAGATTIWEHWDSFMPQKGFADPIMNSFSHYANGAVGDFLFGHLAGVRFLASEDGYRVHFSIIPCRQLGIGHTGCHTPCGIAENHWEIWGDELHLRCIVPPNTIGILEGNPECHLPPGTYNFTI